MSFYLGYLVACHFVEMFDLIYVVCYVAYKLSLRHTEPPLLCTTRWT